MPQPCRSAHPTLGSPSLAPCCPSRRRAMPPSNSSGTSGRWSRPASMTELPSLHQFVPDLKGLVGHDKTGAGGDRGRAGDVRAWKRRSAAGGPCLMAASPGRDRRDCQAVPAQRQDPGPLDPVSRGTPGVRESADLPALAVIQRRARPQELRPGTRLQMPGRRSRCQTRRGACRCCMARAVGQQPPVDHRRVRANYRSISVLFQGKCRYIAILVAARHTRNIAWPVWTGRQGGPARFQRTREEE